MVPKILVFGLCALICSAAPPKIDVTADWEKTVAKAATAATIGCPVALHRLLDVAMSLHVGSTGAD